MTELEIRREQVRKSLAGRRIRLRQLGLCVGCGKSKDEVILYACCAQCRENRKVRHAMARRAA